MGQFAYQFPMQALKCVGKMPAHYSRETPRYVKLTHY